MKLINRILLATDFLQGSEQVVEQGLMLAKAFEAEILPIYVLPPEHLEEKLRKMIEDAAWSKLNNLRAHILQQGGKCAKPFLANGLFHDVIVDRAERLDANIIVIGAGAKPAGDKHPLGTTAAKIIRQSNKPVWVVKPAAEAQVKNILCPTDFSAPATLALKNAIIIARRLGAQLTVLSINEPFTSRGLLGMKEWQDQLNRLQTQYDAEFEAYLQDFNWRDVQWQKVLKRGESVSGILEAIKDFKTDLLIMGTTGRSGLSKWMMGSVTAKVTRELPCSFITTKEEDVVRLQLEAELQDIEMHYEEARQLTKDGFVDEAIQAYKACLKLSDTHLPAITGLAKLYEIKGNHESAAIYRKMARDVLDLVWNAKIEEDARRHYK